MKLLKIIKGSMLVLILITPGLGWADIDANLPDLGDPYDNSIRNSGIWQSIMDGHYNLAWHLAKDEVYLKARKVLMENKNVARILPYVSDEFNKIIDDSSKTDEQKADEVIELIMGSITNYEYSKNNSLNTALKYSPEYGAMLITWDKTYTKFNCDGYGLQCSYDPWAERNFCTYVQWTDHVTKAPSYKIYRIKNGVDDLITTIDGYTDVRRSGVSLSTDFGWGSILANAYDYLSFEKLNIADSRAFFIDLHTDVRNKGVSLDYKIVASTDKYGKCGTDRAWTAQIEADSDGDGRIDFIPNAEYSRLFGKYYGWMVPVINMTLL